MPQQPKQNNKTVELQITGEVRQSAKHVPKAYLRSNKIPSDQFKQKVQMSATYWVPKADIRYNPPACCLTIKLGSSKLQIFAQDPDELEQIISDLMIATHERMPDLRKAYMEEKKRWMMQKKAFDNAKSGN